MESVQNVFIMKFSSHFVISDEMYPKQNSSLEGDPQSSMVHGMHNEVEDMRLRMPCSFECMIHISTYLHVRPSPVQCNQNLQAIMLNLFPSC